MYTVTTKTASVTDGVERNSTVLTRLDPGTAVHVVEVVRRDDLRRVRGRIDNPVAGWISLENMDTGFRWIHIEIAPSAARFLMPPDGLAELWQH